MSDHLDRETSVSAELTETGVKAKSQSRFVAAVDRFGGNVFELMNAPMERRIARQRAIAAGEAELIAAVTKFGIEKLHADQSFAERTAERHFTQIFEKQRNKDAVLREALEDLRHDPSPDSATKQEPLSIEFLDRLEPRAEAASSEQLRQKWGRVLSAEIKRPGKFSAKVMRVVDELDAYEAHVFEDFCKSAIEGVVPKCLVGNLSFAIQTILVSAELLLDPGMAGHVSQYKKVRTGGGDELWVYDLGDKRSVSIPTTLQIEAFALPNFVGPLQLNDGVPATSAYLLTEVGNAISTIFPANDAASRYVAELRKAFPKAEIVEYQADQQGRYSSLPHVTVAEDTG